MTKNNKSLELKKMEVEILRLKKDIEELKRRPIISPELESVLVALGTAQTIKTIHDASGG